ncbi:hypothetical protein LTR70_007501 [Exophiala xenobiotica]|uniref:RING-type domain-containing protein n=1 Tax=Lithohypha guttulata TaxID=1690604 RepID=A0ABR0K408_9EURO|nr:hypothetical protein LTR24_007134 [Lithohypha guttulata]KAK5313660.1 hypothetical protein LTR70_007501 [Exophiala xenobiotica]
MSNRVEGERVFCYQCENEWDRAHGGLQCPRCESEFVEILSPGGRSDVDDPPEVAPDSPMSIDDDRPFPSLRDHNPWGSPAPDPDEGDIRTIHFNTGGAGHGTFQFSRTYTTGFGGPRRQQQQQQQQQDWNTGMGNDPAADDIMRNFQGMVNNILGGGGRMAGGGNSASGGTININGRTTHFGSGTRDAGFPGPAGPPAYDPDDNLAEDAHADPMDSLFSMLFPGNAPRGAGQRPIAGMGGPFDMLSMLLDPQNARSGDAVFSQEAFDRVMSQLMEQNQQNGAPPASQDLINQLPKKQLEKSMAGDDGKAECSICMDNVELGTEVTVLPCNHWFHFECIESWLKEHDTCPHCRKPITPPDQRNPQQTRPQAGRHSGRRPSSVATPFTQMPQEGSRQNPYAIPDSPSDIRAAREQYYGRQRTEHDHERPSSERRSSRRSTGNRDEGGGGGGAGGGVGGWIRSHMPFS